MMALTVMAFSSQTVTAGESLDGAHPVRHCSSPL